MNLQPFCTPPAFRQDICSALLEPGRQPVLHAVSAIIWPTRPFVLSRDTVAAATLVEECLQQAGGGAGAAPFACNEREMRLCIIACWLLRGGADPRQQQQQQHKTAPMIAVAAGNCAVAAVLVFATRKLYGQEAAAELVAARDAAGNTLLHYVAHAGHTGFFVRLVDEFAANYTAKNIVGNVAVLLLLKRTLAATATSTDSETVSDS